MRKAHREPVPDLASARALARLCHPAFDQVTCDVEPNDKAHSVRIKIAQGPSQLLELEMERMETGEVLAHVARRKGRRHRGQEDDVAFAAIRRPRQ